MCENNHPLADAAGLGGSRHDHEESAEAQLDAAAGQEPGSEESETALELARVEALLALARNVGRIAAVLEKGVLYHHVQR